MSIRLRVKCRPWSGMPFAHFSIALRMLGCGSVTLNMQYVKRPFSFVLDQAHHKSQKIIPLVLNPAARSRPITRANDALRA